MLTNKLFILLLTTFAETLSFVISRQVLKDEIKGSLRKKKHNCFIVQHIDNKAQFYCRKAGGDVYFAIFLPTHEITYIAGYLLSTEDVFSAP